MKSSPTPNIKLIQALQLLSKNEMQSFIEFADSKYFSGDRKYRRTLESLQKLHTKRFQGMSNSKLLTYLSDELKTSNRTLQNRVSELYLIFERFLTNELLKKDTVEKDKLLLLSLFERKGYRLFEYVAKKAKKSHDLSGMDLKTLEDINKINQFESLAAFGKGNYKEYQRLSSTQSIYLTALFLVNLFIDSTEKIQQGMAGKSPEKLHSKIILEGIDMDKLLKLLKEENAMLFSYVMIYYCIQKCFSDYSDISYFAKARMYHKQIMNDLTEIENQSIYFAFTTYCINQISLGRDDFFRKIFEIIIEKLDAGYDAELHKDNYPVNNFRDYIIIGLRVDEIEWVRNFVSKYSSMIPESYRDDEIKISLSRIAQYEGDFGSALKHLEKIKKKNFLHYIDILNLRIRSYFELGEMDDAYQEVERLKQYLNYHKEIPDSMKKENLSFVKDVLLLFKYSEGQLSASELKYKLRNRDLKNIRIWVAEKFKCIIKRKK